MSLQESESAARRKLEASLAESTARESELRLLSENAIAAANASASRVEEAGDSKAALCEERRIAVERAEALESEVVQEAAKAAAKQLELETALERAEAAEQRGAELDGKLAQSQAGESEALSVVKTELSERVEACALLEAELREAAAARADVEGVLTETQTELASALKDAIETRQEYDAVCNEREQLKAAAESNDQAEAAAALAEDSSAREAAQQAQAKADARAAAAEAALSEAQTALTEKEAALAALSAGKELSKGQWAVDDCCDIELDDGLCTGTVAFLGETSAELGEGTWAGVKLQSARGRNDGTIRGVRYFTCEPGHGILVRPERLLCPSVHQQPPATETPSADSDLTAQLTVRRL